MKKNRRKVYWFSMDGKNQLVATFEIDNRIKQLNIGIHLGNTGLKIKRISEKFLFLLASKELKMQHNSLLAGWGVRQLGLSRPSLSKEALPGHQ